MSEKKNTKIELNRWLSQNAGLSRRKATQIIKDGEVIVDDVKITIPFFMVDNLNKIQVNDQAILPKEINHQYYVVYKPSGYVSSTQTDSSGSPPVTDLITSKQRLYPVGRLDIESEGLIILTNDGDLTYKLTHPKHKIEKEYEVLIEGDISESKLTYLRRGIDLGGKKTEPVKIQNISQDYRQNLLSFILREGKNRQIRRMCAMIDLHVQKLVRIRIGGLELGDLKPGEFKKLSKDDINDLLFE